jgi:hypothetical protein
VKRGQVFHILDGYAMLRIPDAGGDLRDDHSLWREVWLRFQHELLPEWIHSAPGTRPTPWWLFSDIWNDRQAGESEPEYLARHGQIDGDELRAMWADLLEALRHNAIPTKLPAGWERRRTRFHMDQDVRYDDVHRFTVTHPIEGLTDEEQQLVSRFRPAILSATSDDNCDDPQY